jgi:hypothetical protein
MHKRLVHKAAGTSHDGLYDSLLDWFTAILGCGRQHGEWAQPENHYDLRKPELNERGDPKLSSSRIFFSWVPASAAYPEPARPFGPFPCTLGVRPLAMHAQKDGDHGQIVQFARNTTTILLDTVAAWLRIVNRFMRLLGDCSDTTLGVFVDPKAQAVANHTTHGLPGVPPTDCAKNGIS